MRIDLIKRPKGVTIIEGFPGFGLVGTISTEFLIDHLQAEKIGRVWSKNIQPMVAVHDSKVVDPIGIFYSSKYNLVILHALTSVNGIEWDLADTLNDLAKQLQAKEIISVEGVGSMDPTKGIKAFYYTKNVKKWQSVNIEPLKEGIVMGVTGAMLLNLKGTPVSCVFAETHSKLPDSRAAAKVIEVLDNYLGLKVDYKPLLKKADEFEGKIKDILSQTKSAGQDKLKIDKARMMDYVG